MSSNESPTALPPKAIKAALDESFSPNSLQSLGTGAASRLPAAVWRDALHQPLLEFMARPGKALRAELLHLCYGIASGSAGSRAPDDLVLFVEALQSGSLIIDDIEDGSEWRRGGPALHRMIGVPRAINSGTWLYFWAFERLERLEMPNSARLLAHRLVTKVLGECHYGQALDLSLNLRETAAETLGDVASACSELKTGSLVGLSAALGALLGGATEDEVRAFQGYGRRMGTALQMLDDVSGLLDASKLNKAEEDLRLGRITWPWVWIAASANEQQWAALLQELAAVQAGANCAPLVDKLVTHLGAQPTCYIEQQFEQAFAELATFLSESPKLAPLRHYQEHLWCGFIKRQEVA